MSPNPYESPSLNTSPPSRGLGPLRLAARALLNLVIVVAFTAAVAGAIWLFYNGYPWTVSLSTLALFMVAASFAGSTWRERVVFSLTVPFLALGGYVGFRVYFAMFHISWFEAVFNSKGAGPLGLILFVCGFAVATGLAAAWCLDRMTRVWWRVQ